MKQLRGFGGRLGFGGMQIFGVGRGFYTRPPMKNM